jgi:hypothetical protein
MRKISILFLAASSLLIGSCYYDTQEALYGIAQNTPCDTTNITYSGRIAPIIAANCSSCHSTTTSASGNGIVLDSYSTFQQQAINGRLIGDINHSPGFNAMPLSGGMLSPCDISAIQYWVNKGTPNN